MSHAITIDAPWRARPFPGAIPVPTMLAREEVDYLHWLGATCAGRGRICDLGCFLGGSTIALAEGVRANPRARCPILSYDSFVMHPGTARTFPVGVAAGESFRPVFDSYTRGLSSLITVREGLLPLELPADGGRAIYPEQEPIEILFVDCAKRPGVHRTVLGVFGGRLIPGHSIVVQQDFKSYGEYWIALHMNELRDCFEPLHDLPGCWTIAFRYLGGLTAERVAALTGEDDLRRAGVAAVWDEADSYWSDRVRPATRYALRLGRAMHLGASGQWAECLGVLAAAAKTRAASDFGVEASWAAGEWGRATAACTRAAREFAGERITNELVALGDSARASAGAEDQSRQALWRRLAETCAARGWARVVVYGAGRHTAALLRTGWPHGLTHVDAVADDYSLAAEIEGVPVRRPRDIRGPIHAVIVSSDAAENELARVAHESLRHLGAPIVRPYAGAASGAPALPTIDR